MRVIGMALLLGTILIVAFLSVRAVSDPHALPRGNPAPSSVQGAQGVVDAARKQLEQSQAQGQGSLDRAQPR